MDNGSNISNEEIWEYLNGTSDAILIDRIEKEMAANPLFKKEVDESKLLWSDLDKIGQRKQLKSQLHEIHESHFGLVQKSNRKKWIVGLSAAAGIALIATIGNLLYNNNLTSSSDNAAYQEMKKEEASAVENGNAAFAPSQATAFAINDSTLLTSFHVIQNKTHIEVSQSGSDKWILAELLFADESLDLALLKIAKDSLEHTIDYPVLLAQQKVQLGQEIFGLGYPKNDLVYGRGDISSLSGYLADSNAIQVSVPTNPGNSGSPLFDEQGTLIGMIVGKNVQEDGSAYAVDNILIQSFLDSNQVQTSTKNRLRKKKRLEQIEKLKTSIFLLRSSN